MKRFTETTKWEDPWFMELPSKFKLLWSFICDKCDCTGVWKLNLRLASVQIGEKYTFAEVEKAFVGRFVMLDKERFWVMKFVQFQCGSLSENCPAHKPIFQKLREHGIGYPIDLSQYPNARVLNTLQEKEKEEDNGKEGGAGGRKGGNSEHPARLPTSPEAKALAILYRRRLDTEWSEKEIKAFKSLLPIDGEELRLVIRYTEGQRQKGDDGKHRRDLQTFLNNYHGEVDRARQWASRTHTGKPQSTNGDHEPPGFRQWFCGAYPDKSGEPWTRIPESVRTEYRRAVG